MALHVTLSWVDTETDVSNFQISRAITGASVYTVIATVPGADRTYIDAAVVPATHYDYRIAAMNPGGLSPFSVIHDVYVAYPLPTIPTGFTAVVGI